MSRPDAALRAAALAAVRRLDALGLNRGSTGNLSVRAAAGEPGDFWITPTGMPAEAIGADDFVLMADRGEPRRGVWQPSTEWPFHRAVYRARPELRAVVHLHSPHATALACLRRPLPAFHSMVAVAGGSDVPCTPYHLFGTEALSQVVGAAFAHRNACLMANHGLVAAGADLAQALKVAIEIEALCGIYLQALAVGEPVLLSAAEMAQVQERFKTYGQARRADPAA
ncbi:MAG: class II aldolase/adducin family protein [Burkholderiales bacterium]|nr:class II aldolase/adducin family protein [Burkholderiales bacterium]